MSRVSRRSLVARLEATRSREPLDDVFAEDLAARLQSLAVASSFETDARKGRLGRKVVAVLGSIGVVGWIGVTGAAASVGLAATGNLPAPVQNAVSTVFDVVGIDVPRADDEPGPTDDQAPIQVDEVLVDDVLVDDTVVDGLVEAPDDTLVSADDTVPADAPTPPTVIDEESPVPSSRPGNSGNTPAVTAPGRVDDDKNDDKPSATAPGQTDDKNDDKPSVTAPGQSDDKPSATAPGQTNDKNDDKPSVTAPGQTNDKNDDKPSATAPGQVGRDDDEDATDDSPAVTAPGQSNKVDKSTPPGQVKKSDDDSSSSKKNKD